VSAQASVSYLSAAGLLWDIAGAYLLAKGLLISNRGIVALASSGWGSHCQS